jgi:hypothetical protein
LPDQLQQQHDRGDHAGAAPGLGKTRMTPESVDGRETAAHGQRQLDQRLDHGRPSAQPHPRGGVVSGLLLIRKLNLSAKRCGNLVAMRLDGRDLPRAQP